jgi:hypothetical protein
VFGCTLVLGDLVGVAARTEALPASPVAEFEVVWDGLLSTSQAPADDAQRQWLRANGVNTIVTLDDRMFDVAEYGFESFLWVRLDAGTAPAEAQAARLLKFIQMRDNQPVHISGGARDSRATVVALIRYAVDGWTIDQALAEGQRINGGAPLSAQQVAWLQGWASSHPPGSHRL